MRQRFLTLTVRYINTNETYIQADILRDFASILITSNNLTVYFL